VAQAGKKDIGGTFNSNSVDTKEVYKIPVPSKGILRSITMALRCQAGSSGAIRAVAYADDGTGKPGALLAVGPEVVLPAGAGLTWIDFPVPATPWSGISFVHAGIWAGATTNQTQLAYDTLAGAGYWEANTYSSGGNPLATWTAFNAHTHGGSVYINYSGGIMAVLRMRLRQRRR